jgi:hypothetical protein
MKQCKKVPVYEHGLPCVHQNLHIPCGFLFIGTKVKEVTFAFVALILCGEAIEHMHIYWRRISLERKWRRSNKKKIRRENEVREERGRKDGEKIEEEIEK